MTYKYISFQKNLFRKSTLSTYLVRVCDANKTNILDFVCINCMVQFLKFFWGGNKNKRKETRFGTCDTFVVLTQCKN